MLFVPGVTSPDHCPTTSLCLLEAPSSSAEGSELLLGRLQGTAWSMLPIHNVGGVRTTFGNVALRIDSKLSWAARSGRPFPEGLPCLWGEATIKLKAGSAPPGDRLGDLGWEGSLLAWTTPGGRRVAIFQAIPLISKKSRSEKSQDPGSLGLGGWGVCVGFFSRPVLVSCQ